MVSNIGAANVSAAGRVWLVLLLGLYHDVCYFPKAGLVTLEHLSRNAPILDKVNTICALVRHLLKIEFNQSVFVAAKSFGVIMKLKAPDSTVRKKPHSESFGL